MACGTGSFRGGALEIHHLALGQADATLVLAPDGHTLLVDVGEERWDSNAGARAVGERIEALLGCRRLDAVVLTHFHLDHTGFPERGGLWDLVVRQGFTVGVTVHRDLRRFAGRAGETWNRWRALLDDAAAAAPFAPRVARVGPAAESGLSLGPDVQLRVVAADGNGVLRAGDYGEDAQPPNEDDYSLALVLRFGRFDYVIGGDLSGAWAPSGSGYSYHDVEHATARAVGDVDVLRVNHHGSRHASSAAWLAQLAPRAAIISVGAGNAHGLPHREALDRLRGVGARVFATGAGSGGALAPSEITGAVVVRTDGVEFSVAGERFLATDPVRTDGDGDGWFAEADPDDQDATRGPPPNGGCDARYQPCAP